MKMCDDYTITENTSLGRSIGVQSIARIYVQLTNKNIYIFLGLPYF